MASRILYCHCAYAKVVPPETKSAVLEGLGQADVAFEAVPDLCEMAARRDPALARLAGAESLRIAACYPRAVRWLFASAGAPLTGQVTVFNMRTDTPDAVLAGLCSGGALAPPDVGGPEGPPLP
jgi:hypothetical protein